MRASKSSLFLTELMLSILFFSIAAAVCVQIFAKAHSIDKSTDELNNALIISQNAAECFIGCNGDISEVAKIYMKYHSNTYELLDNTFISFYDDKWNKCDRTLHIYTLIMNVYEDGTFNYADITVNKSNSQELIYELNIKKHIQ